MFYIEFCFFFFTYWTKWRRFDVLSFSVFVPSDSERKSWVSRDRDSNYIIYFIVICYWTKWGFFFSFLSSRQFFFFLYLLANNSYFFFFLIWPRAYEFLLFVNYTDNENTEICIFFFLKYITILPCFSSVWFWYIFLFYFVSLHFLITFLTFFFQTQTIW